MTRRAWRASLSDGVSALLLAALAASCTPELAWAATPNEYQIPSTTPLLTDMFIVQPITGTSRQTHSLTQLKALISGGAGAPGGLTTQLQYNNAGALGGISGATTDGTTVTLVGPFLGTPAVLVGTNITGTGAGFTAGQATALATGRTISITGDMIYTSPAFNGSGNVTAAGSLPTVNSNVGSFTNMNATVDAKGRITAASNGAPAGAPGGSNTQLQYNNAGAFGGVANATSNGTNMTKLVVATTAATAGFAVGPNGTTNPGINYDGSQASASTGLNIKSFATGSAIVGGLAVSVISPATDEFLRLDAQGGGGIVLGNTSTGQITLNRNTVLNTAAVNQVICTDGSKIIKECGGGGTANVGDVAIVQTLKFNGHLLISDAGSAPGVSGCGTGASVGNNTATAAFIYVVGTAPPTTCTLTFPAAARTGWHCSADDITTPAEVLHQTAYTTTSCVLTYYGITTGVATAPTASDVIPVTAMAF